MSNTTLTPNCAQHILILGLRFFWLTNDAHNAMKYKINNYQVTHQATKEWKMNLSQLMRFLQ